MQFYFSRICEATSALSKHPSPKVGAQAFEYWTTLVEDETERMSKGVMCMGYIRGCFENLLQMILQGISIVSFEEDDEDEDWGHALSAACCLQKLSIFIGNDIMDTVVGFAASNIQSADWKLRYSACISLGSITEGPDKQKFLDLMFSALPSLLSMFNDKNAKIREALSWVFHRICEHHPDFVSNK